MLKRSSHELSWDKLFLSMIRCPLEILRFKTGDFLNKIHDFCLQVFEQAWNKLKSRALWIWVLWKKKERSLSHTSYFMYNVHCVHSSVTNCHILNLNTSRSPLACHTLAIPILSNGHTIDVIHIFGCANIFSTHIKYWLQKDTFWCWHRNKYVCWQNSTKSVDQNVAQIHRTRKQWMCATGHPNTHGTFGIQKKMRTKSANYN